MIRSMIVAGALLALPISAYAKNDVKLGPMLPISAHAGGQCYAWSDGVRWYSVPMTGFGQATQAMKVEFHFQRQTKIGSFVADIDPADAVTCLDENDASIATAPARNIND